MTSIEHLLPPNLLLPPHLSAHRYLFVCTLTIAAWDTLVLSARTWHLMKSPEWPPLKIILLVLRYLMPIEFIAVGVAFFSPDFSKASCDHFYLFEPIVTAILTSLASAALVLRISALYDRKPAVFIPLSVLLGVQVAVQFACCFFYRSVPLLPTQGCIAGPKHNWVGIYWALPTILYITSFVLATIRMVTNRNRSLGWWKLMLRDGVNLYAAVAIVNLINVLFWFISKPTDASDSIKTITTSMTTVLTCTMTIRIILLIRGSLARGGAPTSSSHQTSTSMSASRSTTHKPFPPVTPAAAVYDPTRSAGAPIFAVGRAMRPGFEFEDPAPGDGDKGRHLGQEKVGGGYEGQYEPEYEVPVKKTLRPLPKEPGSRAHDDFDGRM